MQLDGASVWLGLLSLAFLALAAVATLANLARVEIAPALVFVYGILGPLAVFFSVRRLWPAGGALTASRCIVALGALQLVVVAFIDLPRFIGSNDPDEVTGTFGTNAYQMVFFLILVVALLIGIRAHEPRRLAARVAPLMIFGCLAAIVLAQYRSLLLTSALALVLAAALVSRSPRRAMTLGVTAVASFVVVLVLAAQYVPVLKVNETVELSPVELLEKRIEIADQLDSLYTSNPRFALTGTGPGTYSSRGWQTFALAESTSQSNVAGGLALALTGGGAYHTDVSDQYVRPVLRNANAVAGSDAVNSPFAEYIGVAAEVGLLGLLAVVGIYGIAFVSGVRLSRLAVRSGVPGDPVPAILVAATVGFFVLLQMGVIQNWLEVSRLTFPVWIMLAIGMTERERAAEVAEP